MYNLKQGVASLADLKDGSLFTMAAAGGKVIRVSSAGDGDYATVQAGLNAANSGDVVLIDVNSSYNDDHNASIYTEDCTLTNKDNITIIGIGGKGAVRIDGASTNGSALTLTGCRDINLINLKFKGLGTGAGLTILGTGESRRIRAYGCWFMGVADGVRLNSGTGGCADQSFENCVFEECANGINILSVGGGNPVSQTLVKNCGFYYYSAWAIFAQEYTVSLHVVGSWFGLEEDGTLPTGGFIDADSTNTTGLVAGNFFSDADAGSAEIKLATEVFFVGNYTEEGVSAARPD